VVWSLAATPVPNDGHVVPREAKSPKFAAAVDPLIHCHNISLGHQVSPELVTRETKRKELRQN